MPIAEIRSADPDVFTDAIAGFNGPCTVRPTRRHRFHAALKILSLGSLQVGRIRMRRLEYKNRNSRSFVSAVVPLASSFDVTQARKTHGYSCTSAHVLGADGPVRYASEDGTVLVVNIGLGALEEAKNRLTGTRASGFNHECCELSLLDSHGADFIRSAIRLWSAALHPSAGQQSVAMIEQRATVIEQFLLATSLRKLEAPGAQNLPETRAGLTRAEGWICANVTRPITRTELCEVSGLNVRTLTRGFEQRHGVGPIAFARARRLEAMQRALLAAEPGGASVTDIAYDHGFSHLGRFATEYRRAFGELPSATLRS
ncbi:MAG: AraC family transcriptional regulator [Gammaproteobacteria bacterium]